MSLNSNSLKYIKLLVSSLISSNERVVFNSEIFYVQYNLQLFKLNIVSIIVCNSVIYQQQLQNLMYFLIAFFNLLH